jgi:hypothetical protein
MDDLKWYEREWRDQQRSKRCEDFKLIATSMTFFAIVWAIALLAWAVTP